MRHVLVRVGVECVLINSSLFSSNSVWFAVSLLLAADTDEEGSGAYRNIDLKSAGLSLLCHHAFISSTSITCPSPPSSMCLRLWPAHSQTQHPPQLYARLRSYILAVHSSTEILSP